MSDHKAQRLFIDRPLAAGHTVPLEASQANYLLNVLRLDTGSAIHVFNGRDGEWLARIVARTKKACTLVLESLTRAQHAGPDIDYLFAPLKHARLDYMVQKATELGVFRLIPVITRRTIAERVNLDRMRANAIEAAEQCGILRIPEVAAPVKLDKAIAAWDPSRSLVFCDETAAIADPIRALREGVRPNGSAPGLQSTATRMRSDPQGPPPPIAVLIGPEGGFDPVERELLLRQPFTLAISLGPRIMRADTAAVAALAIVNAAIGDWR